jgi:putative sigma-54 modulation protein
MKISYTGRHEEFPPKQRAKLEAKIQKLSKMMMERKGEKEVHVILSQERFLSKVEITMNAWDHALVGVGTDSDLVTAAHAAVDRLEKQIVKVRAKLRDTQRHRRIEAGLPQAVPLPVVTAKGGKKPSLARAGARDGNSRKKVFRVNHRDGSKPMTVEEAMLEMEASQDYMVYRDALTDRVTVLMRRPDGHFDLIES